MLTETSIKAAVPLAMLLANKGVVVEPAQGTALQQLVNASTFHLNVQYGFESEDGAPVPAAQEVKTIDDFAGALHGASATPDGEGSNDYQHDALLEDFAGKASEAVLFNLRLAKNEVRAQITAVVEEAAGAISANETSAANPLIIVPRGTDALLDNGLLQEVSGRYREATYDDMSLSLRVPMPQNLVDYLRTDMGAYDGALSTYVDSIGTAGVQELWEKLFGGKASTLADIVQLSRPDSWAQAVLASVIVSNTAHNVPEGVNVPLEDFRVYTAKLQSNLGRVLSEVPGRRQADIESGRLVVSAPRGESPRGEIVVNADVYQRYLEQGGTPEAIFGALNDGRLPSVAELIERREQFETRWRSMQQTLLAAEVQRRYTATITAFRRTVARFISEIPQDQANGQAGYNALHERLNDQLGRLTTEALQDMWSAGRSVVCGTLYSHTQVEKILRIIDRTMANNGDGEQGENLLLAVVDYIAEWLSYQVIATRPAG